ncbi:MAG: hypothetical protein PUC29_05545 [Clostridia bacterium]|nr:hypothetical protein [Clostridia bacterium]
MKKLICLVLALALSALVFTACAKKAQMQTLDPVKVTSVQTSSKGELDREAAVSAYNSATAGKVVTDDGYKTGEPILFITSDGIVEVFETGENKFTVSSALFDYAFEIEAPELYKLFKGE